MTFKKRLTQWHKALGALLALAFVVLAITGIMLNHVHGLKLDHSRVGWSWLKSLYGINSTSVQGFDVEGKWLFAVNDTLFLNSSAVSSCLPPLMGAVKIEPVYYAACANGLLIITEQGELVETLSLPISIQKIKLGTHQNTLLARLPQQLLRLDEAMGQWQPEQNMDANEVTWSINSTVAQELLAQLPTDQQASVTWERVILDFHSGRLFGSWGVWLVDLLAIGLIFSSLSGFWLWFAKSKPGKHRRTRDAKRKT